MHIPDSMLNGPICPVSAAVGLVGIGASAYFALRAREKPAITRFAGVASLVFAAQMVNFPISDGTSGHLLGGVLAASLLGTPFAVLALSLVLAVQAFVFSDGGIATLGVNVLNMAILGAGFGGVLFSRWNRERRRNSRYGMLRLAGISWISVVFAALAASVELAVAGTVPFSKAAFAMLTTYSVIGVGEATITVVLFSLLSKEALARALDWNALLALAPATAIALLVAPLACNHPDGLEWIARSCGFLRETRPIGLLADYVVPFVEEEFASVALAATIGVFVSFGAPLLLFRGIERMRKWRKSPLPAGRSRASAA